MRRWPMMAGSREVHVLAFKLAFENARVPLMGKQLNIRSDEAYVLAHRLARAQKRSVTAVVVNALRQEALSAGAEPDIFSEEAVAERMRLMQEVIRSTRENLQPGTIDDHGDMYDENGLPV